MISVSVALATYNGEQFLPRQLESLAWQTQLPSELVVTDDCSSDNTVDMLKDFSRSAPFPVRIVVNDETLNYRANFLKAAGLCSSDIILFCDQDDIWRQHKVETISNAFAADPTLSLVYHNATVVDVQERSLYPVFDAAEQDRIEKMDIPPPWHFARGLLQGFRRELLAFDDLWPLACEHFDSGRLGHDRWYFFLALAADRIRFIDEDLLMYRQHGNNAYGADRQLSWARRTFERLRHHPASDLFAAKGARSRVAVLQALQSRVPAECHPRIQRLADAYSDHAGRLERRSQTFAGASLPARAAALARSVLKGDYCGNPWGFDPRSVLRDAVLGVGGLGR
jgi:glycosyltransferase involved in cell wall biosynthesis